MSRDGQAVESPYLAGEAWPITSSGPESSADAVVIGAGHNGLVAANLLVDAGWDVVVCEATEHLGGAVRSANVTAAGFQSDLFSAFYPLAAASPILHRLHLERFGLQWAHAPKVVAHVLPDGRSAAISRDVQATAASLEQFAPGDGEAWMRLHEQWQAIQSEVLTALFTQFPPVMALQRLVRTLGVGDSLRLARMAALPVRRFGEETFRGEGGAILVAGNAMHADLPPDGAGSALYGWLLSMLAQTHGFPVPVGGSGQLSHALGTRLTRAGGQVRLASPVEQLLLEGTTAVGVQLASGQRIRARRAVLADVSAPILYRDLVGLNRLPTRFVADLNNFQWDSATLKIDWALSSPVPWTAAEISGAGTVQLGVDMNGLTDYAADLACGRIPRSPFVLFGQMSTADPSRSPAGTESAWAYTHLPHRLELSDDDVREHVQRVEDLLERHAPGFGSRIIGRHVQSPTRLQQEDPNLIHGAINGGTAQLHQQLIFRPVPGLGGAATPLDRLFLAGSSAHPGGGVHGGPGANAARAALARAGLSGRARQRARAALMAHLY